MLCASVSGAGEVLRCGICGAPGDVAATDLPDSLRADRRRTVVVWCRRDALEQLAAVERLAAMVADEGLRQDAVQFARAMREALATG